MNQHSPGAEARYSDRIYTRLQRALAPGLRNSQYQYAERLRLHGARAHSWLDLGCGRYTVPDWAAASVRMLSPLVGIDMDPEALRKNALVRFKVVANGEALPFADASFDLVTANMVLEHVAEPDRLFREVSRVLVPDGVFLTHTPNRSGYTTILTRVIPPGMRTALAGVLHGRQPEDVYPTHYRANSAHTLRSLAHDTGFAMSTVEYVLSSPQLIRIPPLLMIEMLLIAGLTSDALATLRPCLLATFRRGTDDPALIRSER
jgi:ubiquinone/menaquinone biosynthesis C-methylase UbiE